MPDNETNARRAAAEATRAAFEPLTGGSDDYDRLLERIGNARFVLIGEASHGTKEFYRERARITRRLIEEKGFHAVAVEADWPDAYRVNRYLAGHSHDTPLTSLSDFERFPLWMWRNQEVLEFLTDVAEFGATTPEVRRPGFYGLDLYSLYGSMDAVIGYLDRVDPEAARRARREDRDVVAARDQRIGHTEAMALLAAAWPQMMDADGDPHPCPHALPAALCTPRGRPGL